jgi:GAF domain-containing protein
MELPRSQGGLTRQILDTGEPIKIDNAIGDPRVRKAALDEGTRSLIGVCLQMGDEKIGVLFVNGERKGQFSKYDMQILQTLANQASLALGSRRLLLKPAMEIEESSLHLFRLDAILGEVCQEIKERFGFYFAAIHLIRPEERIIETVHGTGIAEDWSGLAKHYLEEDPELRNIQADIALANPPRMEIIHGWDNRFDRYLYTKFKHAELVRSFVPMILARDENGKILHHWYEHCRWKETQRSEAENGWRRVLETELKGPPGDGNDISHEIIGTVEVGYQNPEAQITNEQAEELSRYIAQKTLEIYRASLSYLLETFTKQAMEIIGADSASTHFLYDNEQSCYFYESCAGNIGPRFLRDHPPRENGLGRQALERREPLFIPNPHKGHGDLELRHSNPKIFDEGVRAMAAFPLLVDEQKEGVLYIIFGRPHRFTEDEIKWVQLLSNRAVETIRRTIAHTQMRDRTRQMSTLNTLGQYLAQIMPEGGFLEEIAWNSLQIFGTDVVYNLA